MVLFLKSAIRLTQRGLVRVRGVDARSFLNEIFSRDVKYVILFRHFDSSTAP